MLSATKGWLDKAEPKTNSDVLSFDAASLRFVDLLTLSQDQTKEWITSIIDLNIHLSQRKREKIFNFTKQTTSLFYGNLFSQDER